MRGFGLCTVLLTSFLALERAEAAVYLGQVDDYTWAFDGNTAVLGYDSNLTLPYSAEGIAAQGPESATTQASRTESLFSYAFAAAISVANTNSSEVQSYGDAYFTVDQNTPYAVTGNFNVTGAPADASIAVAILDESAGYMLYDYNISDSTTNPNLQLGSPGSSQFSAQGSLTGTLQPGDDYEFFYVTSLQNLAGIGTDATAIGSISLAFGSAVPEPSTLIVWSLLGALGLAASFARKQYI